jgi:glycosyltransferase involved in cell wall biosynthesis/GT2 family glycosyltransferase
VASRRFCTKTPESAALTATVHTAGSRSIGDISVVIPLYNHAPWIASAIRSVFAQTLLPREIIVIDDGSTDGGLLTLNAFLAETPAPEGVEITLIQRENRGAHATLNEGIERSSGEYVAILNSDDEFTPERLETCRAAALAAKARFVITYVEPIGPDGRSVAPDHPWRRWYAQGRLSELDVLPTLGFTLLFGNVAVTTGNFFIRRDLAREAGPFRPYRFAHDLDFLLRAVALEEPYILREALYRYRLHGSNTINAEQSLVDAECADIYADYLVATAETCPANPMAPTLERFPATLTAFPLPGPFKAGLDSLIKAPRPEAAVTPERPSNKGFAPPDVLLVGHELSRTGAPMVLLDIARALQERAVVPEIVSPRDGPLRREIESEGVAVRIEISPLQTWSDRLARLARPDLIGSLAAAALGRSSRLLAAASRRMGGRRRRTSRALVNSSSAFPLASRLLDRTGCRVVWYIHETLDPALILRTGADLERFRDLTGRPGSIRVYGSEATRRAWAAAGFDGVVRYWSGLKRRPTEMRPASRGRRTILSVGTSGPRKGTGDLIEAFARAIASGAIPDDVDLCIVGCQAPSIAPHSRDLLRRIWKEDVRGRVRLVGSVAPADLEPFYREASLYVQASTMECLPLALLTAMSHGLPIVTTDAGGCGEAVLDRATGLVVPSRSLGRLADAMATLLADRDLACAFGAAAKARFDDCFALEVTAGPLIALLLDDDPQ